MFRSRYYHFNRLVEEYPILYLIFVGVGIYALYGAIKMPDFFWEHKTAIKLRNTLGDGTTRVFYGLAGIFLIILGMILTEL